MALVPYRWPTQFQRSWHQIVDINQISTQPFIQTQIKQQKSTLRVTGLCAGNSPVTGEFPAQMASNAENVPIDDVIMILLFLTTQRTVLYRSCRTTADVQLATEAPGLTLIPAWISNYIHHNMWDEITYSFPNFNGCTVEVWDWISNFVPHFPGWLITYPCCD